MDSGLKPLIDALQALQRKLTAKAFETHLQACEVEVQKHAIDLCGQLGLNPDPAGTECLRITRFLIANGHAGVRDAVKDTMRMVKKSGRDIPVASRWGYVVNLVNGRWARSRDLYVRLSLYENALRSRVSHMAEHQLGATWWATPANYMISDEYTHMLRENPGVRAAKPTGPTDVPAMKTFASGGAFLEELHLSELHDIVLHLWAPVFDHVINVDGMPLVSYDKMRSDSIKLEKARNDLMHAKPEKFDREAFTSLRSTLDSLLARLGFDMPRTVERIQQVVLP